MRRPPVLAVALLVGAVVATALAVGAVAWAIRDNHSPARMGTGMMAADSGSTPGWWDDSWGSMMRMMDRAGVAGEPEYLAEMTAHHQEAVTAARDAFQPPFDCKFDVASANTSNSRSNT